MTAARRGTLDDAASHVPTAEGQGLFDVVVPTIARPSLATLLRALDVGRGPLPGRVLLVDDRKGYPTPPPLDLSPVFHARVRWLRSGGRGPAAARNVGWRAATAPWVVFVDDDVVPEDDWRERLVRDLSNLPGDVAASQGQIRVPLPSHRRPTDWERNVKLLETADAATADMAYRRHVLDEVGGFDERFRRAYREDSDLALRVRQAGYEIRRGRRRVTHPVRPSDPFVSVRLQAGNADDVLMGARHGRWETPSGRRPVHLLITGAGIVALTALAARRKVVAEVAAAVWLGGTVEFALARVLPGPPLPKEILTVVATSFAIPPAASAWWIVGLVRRRRLLAGRTTRPML